MKILFTTVSFLFSIVVSIAIFLLAILVPSIVIKFGVDSLFDVNADIFGIFALLFAVISFKHLFFDKE